MCAISMAPWQEIAHHLRAAREFIQTIFIPDRADHPGIGGDHAVEIDDRLGFTCGPRRHHVFCHCVRRETGIGFIHRRSRRPHELFETYRLVTLGRVAAINDEATFEIQPIQRALIVRPILDIDEFRLGQAINILEAAKVFAEQRIGRCDGHGRAARPHGGIHDQGIGNGVLRQDHQRRVRSGAGVEEALREPAHGIESHRIRDRVPAFGTRIFRIALGEPYCVRPMLGPMDKRCQHMWRASFQRLAVVEVDRAVGSPIDLQL